MFHVQGLESIREVYKHMDSIMMITLAPEIPNGMRVCRELTEMGIIVSIGCFLVG